MGWSMPSSPTRPETPRRLTVARSGPSLATAKLKVNGTFIDASGTADSAKLKVKVKD